MNVPSKETHGTKLTTLSLAALGGVLWLSRNLVLAVAALVVGRTAVLVAYDRPRGSEGESLSRSGGRAVSHLGAVRPTLPYSAVQPSHFHRYS